MKNQRENFMYTIKDAKVESIACDDNGAYLNSRSNKRYYRLSVRNGCVISKVVHSSDGKHFHLKERNGRDYETKKVDISDVYIIERYYRQNKSIRSLKRLVVRIKAAKSELYENYCCVIYSKSEDDQNEENEPLLHHGNVKSFAQPYIRTSAKVLKEADNLISQKK